MKIHLPAYFFKISLVFCLGMVCLSFAKDHTLPMGPCIPTSTSGNQYISVVSFLGTLNADSDNLSFFSTSGYGDYKNLAKYAKQIPGGVVNVNVGVSDAQGIVLSTTKAWVDWNRDDIFDGTAVEKVYDISGIGAMSGNVIFGFVVPPGTSPGFYTIRIRASGTTSNFDACSGFTSGETEDYRFEVISDCSATVVSVTTEKRCGPGSVLLSAAADADTISYVWSTSEYGSALPGENGNAYRTPALSVGTYTYYVAAFNGTCYSVKRTPVKVVVSPAPVLQFAQSSPDLCGPVNSLVINSSADKEEVTLLEDRFENTADQPLLFENVTSGDTAADGIWKIRDSPYVPTTPPYNVVKPAISSGFEGGYFANIITDVRQKTNIINHFVLKNTLDTTGLTELRLDYDLYYFSEEDLAGKNSLTVQYSLDGGTTWTDLKKYISDVGIPSRFQTEILLLPKICENQTRLKIRFSAYALGSANEWMADIVALDNVRLAGNREVPANFRWTGNTALFDQSCTAAPSAQGSPSICIKPTDADIQTKPFFEITASATLANGCNVSRTLITPNNNKIWDTTSSVSWGDTRWEPVNNVPDIGKCVLIKKPVTIFSEGFFEAKNVKVIPGGQLFLKGNTSLKIADALINQAAATDVLLESGAHLVQINDDPELNTGAITAKKTIAITEQRRQYNYLISPLEGQNLKTIYNGIAYALYHNEGNNYFYNSSGAYVKGRGLAIKEPLPTAVPQGNPFVSGTFTGRPANGIFTFNMVNSAPAEITVPNKVRGYNLVGNPYPSAIDLLKLFEINGGMSGNLSPTFYFWDASVNEVYVQQGSDYGGQSYGLFNALSGTGTPATGDITGGNPVMPSQSVSPGTGFMARTYAPVFDLKFKNYIRTSEPTSAPLQKAASAYSDRYWLSLISPANIASTMAVVYFPEGKSDLGKEDSFSLLGSDALYSVVNGENISINGKNPFQKEDVVSLGTRHFENGNYKIRMTAKEGLFAAGQNIYLKDYFTGVVTDLSLQDYEFTTLSGSTSGRFEVVYDVQKTLVTDAAPEETLVVYQKDGDFIVRTSSKKITGLEMYETSGRLILTLKPHSAEVHIEAQNLPSGVYVLKIDQSGKRTTKKIIK